MKKVTDKPTVWMYWEGKSVPPYYALCQESVIKHNPTARVIGPEDLPELIGDLPSILNKCYITHKVDWIRKKLVLEQGGMYVDSDFICQKSLDPILNMTTDFDYVGYRQWGGEDMDNFFGGRKGSLFLKAAVDYCTDILELKSGQIAWIEASTRAIQHAFKTVKDQTLWAHIPVAQVVPVSGYDRSWYFKQLTELNHNCFGYMTSVHSFVQFDSKLRKRSREELMSMDNNLGQIFRKAFE